MTAIAPQIPVRNEQSQVELHPWRCKKCHRPLKNPSEYGPVCARNLFGTKPRKVKREGRRSNDERQGEFWDRYELGGQAYRIVGVFV